MRKIYSVVAVFAASFYISAGAASAVTLTVNSVEYNVTALTGSFNSGSNATQLKAQEWWNDPSLALAFAVAYASAYDTDPIYRSFAYSESYYLPSLYTIQLYYSRFGVTGQANLFSSDANNGISYMTASRITPVPLPAGGALLLTGLLAAAGFGYRKKRAA